MMEYLHTDWASMTLNNWIGTIVTVIIFCLMIWAYVYTFHPKNKEKLESQRHIIFENDDDNDAEDSKK